MSDEQPIDQEESQPRRSRPGGTEKKAGVPHQAPSEPITRTVAMLNAALRVWEAKHSTGPTRSVWTRRSPIAE